MLKIGCSEWFLVSSIVIIVVIIVVGAVVVVVVHDDGDDDDDDDDGGGGFSLMLVVLHAFFSAMSKMTYCFENSFHIASIFSFGFSLILTKKPAVFFLQESKSLRNIPLSEKSIVVTNRRAQSLEWLN